MFHKFKHHRQNGYDNNPQHDFAKIVFHKRQIAKRVAQIRQRQHPRQRADDVVAYELRVIHVAHARHERRERPHNRHKSGNDDGFAAVFFVEVVGFVQVFLLENARVGVGKQLFAEIFANREIDRVANNRRHQQNAHHDVHVQRAIGSRRHRARCKQQRVAW